MPSLWFTTFSQPCSNSFEFAHNTHAAARFHVRLPRCKWVGYTSDRCGLCRDRKYLASWSSACSHSTTLFDYTTGTQVGPLGPSAWSSKGSLQQKKFWQRRHCPVDDAMDGHFFLGTELDDSSTPISGVLGRHGDGAMSRPTSGTHETPKTFSTANRGIHPNPSIGLPHSGVYPTPRSIPDARCSTWSLCVPALIAVSWYNSTSNSSAPFQGSNSPHVSRSHSILRPSP